MIPPSEDEQLLRQLGYQPELARRMSGFSNFAISFSIICILAGGITSFHVGLCSAGGASLGLGWPLACLFSLAVASAMAQIASAFPTAGGLYHWGSLLGGRACGWATAWFNLAGLVTVVAAVNAGTYDFAVAAFGLTPSSAPAEVVRTAVIAGMTLSQGLLNHYGIRLTTWLTDLSGWLILGVASVLTAAVLIATPHFEWSRLWTFSNFSGLPEASPVFPRQSSLPWLFALGLLLPAYTITGFDASAHTSEETLDAARNVPRGIVRSVLISGLFGWVMISALLLALPDVSAGAARGAEVVPWILRSVLPGGFAALLLAGIVLAQYLCGLAALRLEDDLCLCPRRGFTGFAVAAGGESAHPIALGRRLGHRPRRGGLHPVRGLHHDRGSLHRLPVYQLRAADWGGIPGLRQDLDPLRTLATGCLVSSARRGVRHGMSLPAAGRGAAAQSTGPAHRHHCGGLDDRRVVWIRAPPLSRPTQPQCLVIAGNDGPTSHSNRCSGKRSRII